MMNNAIRLNLLSKASEFSSSAAPPQYAHLIDDARSCLSSTANSDTYKQLYAHLDDYTADFQLHPAISLAALVAAVSKLSLTPTFFNDRSLFWNRLPRSIVGAAVQLIALTLPNSFQICWQAMDQLNGTASLATRRRDGLVLHKMWPKEFWAAFHFAKAVPGDKHKIATIRYLLAHYSKHVGHIASLVSGLSSEEATPSSLKACFLLAVETHLSKKNFEGWEVLFVARALEHIGDHSKAFLVLERCFSSAMTPHMRFENLLIFSRLAKTLYGRLPEVRYLATAMRVMPHHPHGPALVRKIADILSDFPDMRRTRDPLTFSCGQADILASEGQFDIHQALQFWLIFPQYLAVEERPSFPSPANDPALKPTVLIQESEASFLSPRDGSRVQIGTDPWTVAATMHVAKSTRRKLLYVEAEDVLLKVAASYSLAFTSKGYPIVEVCSGHASFFSHSTFFNKEIQNLKGNYVSLCVPYGHNNYSHFLLDRVPFLKWIRDWREPIDILFDADAMKFAEPFFRALNSKAKLTPIERDQIYRIEAVRMFSMPQHPLHLGNPDYVEFLRTFVPNWQSRTANKRLIIHRDRGRRGIANQEEFYDFMTALGYEVVRLETMSILQQLELMAEACVIIAMHGAGLANIVTCKPGSVLVEILPNGYSTPAFAITAQAAGLHYFPYLEMSEENLVLATKKQYSDTKITLPVWQRFLKNVHSTSNGS